MAKLNLVVVLCLVACVLGDQYLQNPRGCNDRLNEEGDRQNANRLFDSQNNARGGYCWGPPMSYVEGSILPIQWTSQHGCGGPHVTCTEIIQYMCSDNKGPATDLIRDGTTTQTIPDDATAYNQKNGDGTYTYGMNENYQYYQDCKNRERNKGLFIADQKPNGAAINTRQNPNGNRFGFECTEERDYYPYWHPSPWKDIAVLVPTLEHCAFYQAESQNVKPKNYCAGVTGKTVPNNEFACRTAEGTWMSEPAHGIAPPECKLAHFSRDNHLGNVDGDSETANYTWVLPTKEIESCVATGSCNCVLRMRYNITTNESTGLRDEFIDARSNKKLTNNPTVEVEDGEYTLALNTAQFGRTFQDRSFMFHITPRPKGVSANTKIFNLNVRGKRGNIVQTFPATEYDFTPNRLSVEEGDIVHFQWTGCDTNPAGNQGEGKIRTDRSNIVQIKDLDSNIPVVATNDTVEKALFESAFLRNRMALIDQKGCVSVAELKEKNGNNIDQLDTNCAKLNAAPTPYFDGGLVRMNQTGKFTYMSTRNNNFSNRTQKGQLTVEAKKKKTSSAAVAGIVVASIVVIAAALGGLVYYGKTHPHSAVGRAVDNIRMPSFSSSKSSGSVNNSVRRAPLLSSDHGSN
jgi:hypothetical protein